MVGLIALSSGLEASRFEGFFKNHLSFVRLNHYSPCPSPHLVLGVTRHTDGGALTILAQDDVGGLQVRRKSDGKWVSVKPTLGAFNINIRDVIQVYMLHYAPKCAHCIRRGFLHLCSPSSSLPWVKQRVLEQLARAFQASLMAPHG